MAKKTNPKYERQFSITQKNLDDAGKTNKKLKKNPMAMKYATSKSKELKAAGEAANKSK